MRRYLFPILAVLLLVLVTVGLLLTQLGRGGALDPRSVSPDGAKALAQLLRDRHVDVRITTDGSEAQDLAGSDSTVLVLNPELLPRLALQSLITSGSRVVVVAPDQSQLDDADLPMDVDDSVEPAKREPACTDAIAIRAGVAVTGGLTYKIREGVGCYASSGSASYVSLDGGRVVVLGDGAPFTNDKLDQQGDAALSLLLLGQSDRLVWLVPEAPPLAEGGSSFYSLIPHQVKVAVLALLIGLAVLAVVRGRRLGRVVPEDLPVVVRSAEAVEGTARLYRAARARNSAAEALRSSVRERLRRALSVPAEHRPEALVDAVAARTPRDPGQVAGLLYGLAPSDDAELVALADALDTLDLEVRRP
ncbi:MAG: hypothetical protein QOJ92_2611 [Frankiales bacterium]|nr:hypothetical protein [Frankiales bacterium]